MPRAGRYVGLDLSGSWRRPSGIALIEGESLVYHGTIYSDDEIIALIEEFDPLIVAIDAPLGLPQGRRSLREADRALQRRGFSLLPPAWKGMRLLISRALRLKRILEHRGIMVLETHPTSALRSSGCKSPEELVERILGSRVDLVGSVKDVVDAVIAALVAYAYINGGVWCIEARDGGICILQELCRRGEGVEGW
ncbi:MAG: DUF429 domain-containing protein [Pyrodictiaceae archaeon]